MARGRHLTRLKLRPLSDQARERYLFDWESRDLRESPDRFPQLTSEALFGNTKPLEVEVGLGSGEFLNHLADEDPHTNFLGVEVSRRAAILAASLASERQLNNLRVLRGNFKLLDPLIVANSWRKVYLHFPDPVHRTKDEKRRIFNLGFLDQMARVLVQGGEISVVSDKDEYFIEMLELAEGDSRFEKTHPQRFLEGFEPGEKSRFQRFWERKGVVVKRFILRRL